MSRKPYPSDVSDEEWCFAAPYLALIDEHAPQRRHSLREVFNALRWLAGPGRCRMAHAAQRFAALAGGVPAVQALG